MSNKTATEQKKDTVVGCVELFSDSHHDQVLIPKHVFKELLMHYKPSLDSQFRKNIEMRKRDADDALNDGVVTMKTYQEEVNKIQGEVIKHIDAMGIMSKYIEKS